MTKRDKKILVSAYVDYCKSNISNIENAYRTRPSDRKINAYNYIWFSMKKNNGIQLRVIHAGVQTFTCGYIIPESSIFVYHLPTRVLTATFEEIMQFERDLNP